MQVFALRVLTILLLVSLIKKLHNSHSELCSNVCTLKHALLKVLTPGSSMLCRRKHGGAFITEHRERALNHISKCMKNRQES